MAPLNFSGPDKVEIVVALAAVVGWEQQTAPDPETARAAVTLLDAHGRQAASDLRALSHQIPTESHLAVSLKATLGEASRRLGLPLPSDEQAVSRAQGLARLVEALHRATDTAQGELDRAAGRTTTTKGPQ
ncbi:DUF6415 family natural product biosynthesis protein [Streptomyces noursei]|uniref:DUF6415 family natural product biosynthesis protein n=1 Tax=Streptomyces noursei TaxID=1971 RepID=UPI0023B8718C|nr:DUF6415 family natural product biosynthesis protein [Streptomyces noursei]